MRDSDDGPEVLLVKRNPASRFMGGAWVFPGGAVDAGEGEGDAAHRAAALRELAEEAAGKGEGDPAHRAPALRELAEEANVTVADAAALVPFSRWITPEQVRIRFD